MEKITVTEFAKRKGVSRPLVLRGITEGKIKAERAGRTYTIEWPSQSKAWDENAVHPQKRPANIGGGRPRKDGTRAAAPRQAHVLEDEADDDPGEVGHPRKLADIQRDNAAVQLQISLEKLKRIRGESVSAAETDVQGQKLAAAVIGAFYVIPERVSDMLAGMSNAEEIQQLLLKEFDQATQALRDAYAPKS
jgi:excisionase family DNA binding protein